MDFWFSHRRRTHSPHPIPSALDARDNSSQPPDNRAVVSGRSKGPGARPTFPVAPARPGQESRPTESRAPGLRKPCPSSRAWGQVQRGPCREAARGLRWPRWVLAAPLAALAWRAVASGQATAESHRTCAQKHRPCLETLHNFTRSGPKYSFCPGLQSLCMKSRQSQSEMRGQTDSCWGWGC